MRVFAFLESPPAILRQLQNRFSNHPFPLPVFNVARIIGRAKPSLPRLKFDPPPLFLAWIRKGVFWKQLGKVWSHPFCFWCKWRRVDPSIAFSMPMGPYSTWMWGGLTFLCPFWIWMESHTLTILFWHKRGSLDIDISKHLPTLWNHILFVMNLLWKALPFLIQCECGKGWPSHTLFGHERGVIPLPFFFGTKEVVWTWTLVNIFQLSETIFSFQCIWKMMRQCEDAER